MIHQNFDSYWVVLPDYNSRTTYSQSLDGFIIERSKIFSPECDVPMLRKALEWAEAEAAKERFDQRWRQGAWAQNLVATEETMKRVGGLYTKMEVTCHTAFCFAGRVCDMAGDTFIAETGPFRSAICVTDVISSDTGRVREISHRAQDLLGIKRSAANTLFAADNTIENVRILCDAIVGEPL